MHSRLEQQVRLSIRDKRVDTDLLMRLVETSYREDDSRFHMFIDRVEDSVLVLDENYDLVITNLAARDLLGLIVGIPSKNNMHDFLPGIELDESLQGSQGAMLAEETKTLCRTAAGKPFDADVQVFSLKTGERGKRICIIRKHRPDEAVCEDPGSCPVVKDVDSRDKYLAIMSHELRTPMNAILGMSKHLLQTAMDCEQRESVKTILDAGDVMMSLLNDLLDKSKIDAGKLKLEEVNVDLRHTVRKIERLWRPNIEEKGISFSVKIEDDVPAAVIGDPVRIRQVLSNLLSNATKFTSDGSIILLIKLAGKSFQDEQICFSVRDSGVGMSDEVQGRLFKEYEQADLETGRKYGGTGLGLSISRQLASMMGGDISVESRPGIGSVFNFHAPLKRIGAKVNAPRVNLADHAKEDRMATLRKEETEPVSAKSTKTSFEPEPPEDDSQSENVRILAVEDNPINQRVLAAFLRPIGGDVDWAENGQMALDMLGAKTYDVVLMDIQMPVMDGLDATRALRKSDLANACVPVIAMTANAMLGDRETCLEAGMDDYVSKPIDPKTLYKAIAKLVDAAKAGQRAVAASKQA